MGSYKTVCPNCGGNNYSIFDNGTSKCWNCDYSKRLDSVPYRPLRRSKYIKEIREYYDFITHYYHSCLDDSHRVWLYRRGISDYSIETLRIGFAPDESHIHYIPRIAKIAGLATKENKPVLGGRIIFPFLSEGFVSDVWGRALDDSPIRYKGPAGSSYTRGADYTYCHDYAYKPNAFQRVVRTEGLIKAIVSNQYGIPCIAYPGTNAYRNGTPPMQGQTQIIIFDNQVENRRQLLAAIRKEAERHSNVKIGTLPLNGRSKMDIDTFILQYGIDEYRRVVDGALEYFVWKQYCR